MFLSIKQFQCQATQGGQASSGNNQWSGKTQYFFLCHSGCSLAFSAGQLAGRSVNGTSLKEKKNSPVDGKTKAGKMSTVPSP